MARIEKTVFISYRRKDISWALAVYQYLTSQKYDVFFDFSSLSSGDFEQVILSNIKARAHFVLILTPTTLDRCDEPGDWIRREIETAIDEKRNIIPLFFDGFNFGSPDIAEKLTGKMGHIRRYNGLDVPAGYFVEAMGRLRSRYLTVPSNAVIHPVPTEVRKVVKQEQVAANKALEQNKQDIQELVKAADGKPADTSLPGSLVKSGVKIKTLSGRTFERVQLLYFGIGIAVLAMALLGIRSMIQGPDVETTPTATLDLVATEHTPTSAEVIPTQTASIAPTSLTPLDIGSTTLGQDGMTLIYVPAGNYFMGSESGAENEQHAHFVYVKAFWIDKTEVTNAMYMQCVAVGKCSQPASKNSSTRGNYYDNSEFSNYPVIYVSWDDANDYCSWAGRRLPTEAEWEKAARGISSNIYPWGQELPNKNLLNFNNEQKDTTDVRKYPYGASPYGALDMAGNVWEWVNDWYDPNYYQVSSSSDPQGPSAGEARILRGGSWSDSDVRSTVRYSSRPSTAFYSFGFRCAMDASE